MKPYIGNLVLLGSLLLSVNLVAETSKTPDESRIVEAYKKLDFKSGTIELGQGLAQLQLGERYQFLGQKDSGTVLSVIWNNPPGFDGLGMIVPKDKSLLDGSSWAAVITFDEDGYVSDEDAHEIDYNELLKTMQEASHEANKERIKLGYPKVELNGWAEEPSYDSQKHVMFWAKDLSFETERETHTLNYNIRLLGRRGVLNVNLVGTLDQLSEFRNAREDILQMTRFQEGQRYADYQPGTDKAAAYGLAALVAGGALAQKAGFFKILLATLLASKKFVLIGLVAIGAFLRKFFTKKSN